jgi:putative N6-adenine-specific DNA methylase
MENLTFVAPCLLGLEGICANELKFNGISSAKAENGRVVFNGDFSTLAKANIISRYAHRIQILLAEFKATSFEELFQNVRKINWENFIDKDDAFPVKGKSLNSALHSIPDCQKIIKKATVDRLSSVYNIPWFEETGAIHQIQFLIMNDKVSIMLDTTGESLHKRGYRKNANDAPIKETLAAGMVDLARVRPNHFVVDPMCGSGTILIESALKALKIAPGVNRTFSAEKWKQIPSQIWEQERTNARLLENRDCNFKAVGYDIDENALEIAKENAQKAGVADRITFVKRDIKDFAFDSEYETVITNPPYGERLLDIDEAEKLYKIMGQRFKAEKGKSYTIISPDDDFEKIFGRKADKRRKLYNGMLKCQVYMYYSY